MKNLLTSLVIGGIAFTISSCETETKTDRSGRITDIPDTTLAHFSYSLIPDWAQHKSTSFYDYRQPIVETSGSFTSREANEILVAVPYLSSEQPFTKLFLIKLAGQGHTLIDWFSLDCTTYSIRDLNHDGVDEIIAEHEGTLSNVTPFKTYELISLKNDEVTVIYSNYSQDESNVFHKDTHHIGDTLSTWIDNRLTDIDRDSIFEVVEIIHHTTIEDIIGEEVRTSTKTDSAIVRIF